MAIELPARRPQDFARSAVAAARYPPASIGVRPATRPAAEAGSWPRFAVRALEVLTGALALFLISTLVWGYVWFPAELAVALLVFDVYWLWKSWTIAYHVVKGVRLMRHYESLNWREEYDKAASRDLFVLAWDAVRHVVVIPNYKESEEKLRTTLRALAQADGAGLRIIPVLAMEEAEAGAYRKAAALEREFSAAFPVFLCTFHPAGLPGEVRGKSSNEAWASRRAYEELVERGGMGLDYLTVTSCDADTIFPKAYFDCLTYFFATDPRRYRRFWQAPIFFYNNIWRVPAPLRVPNALSGLIHLSRLSRRRRVLFSQSTYSLSLRMAHEVGYWDRDVIPEDWHMFLKCFYMLGGTVDVQPIHLPLGNDGALSHTPRATYVNQYLQVRRWAWGAVDVPYAALNTLQRTEIPLPRRLLRFWYFFENQLMWSTQWFFITLGGFIPWAYAGITGHVLIPSWFYVHNLLGQPAFFPDWLGWLSITTLILTPCLFFYLILIAVDARLRPPAPPVSRLGRLAGHLAWLATPPITFLFSALPALDSQIRLLLGRRMEYRVTEKA